MGTQPYSAATTPASDSVPPGYRRPVIATVVLAALLTLFFSAGFWQLDRAAEKRTLLQNYASAGNRVPLEKPATDESAEALRFRTFRLAGHYLPDQQVLLDNMTDNGANGYQVLTPFLTGDSYVLVNRGWVPASVDRSVLPDISVSAQPRTILARLNTLPSPGLRLSAPLPDNKESPLRLLFPDREQLQQALAMSLPNYQLELNAEQPDGYLRNWQAVESGPEKHLGYATQWFSFAALACIFYCILIFQWWRSRAATAIKQLSNQDAS